MAIERPSPNFDGRTGPVDILLLHYTGMQSAGAALDRLCDPAAKVSCHWLIDEDGTVLRSAAANHGASISAATSVADFGKAFHIRAL